jgi:hypothetical protein
MSETLTAAQIGAVWKQHEQTLGTSDAVVFAHDLSQAFPYVRFSEPALARTIHRLPTADHLYPGAVDTVQDLLRQGDRVVIWTQGEKHTQLWKLGTSGIGKIRHGLSRQERREFTSFTDEDKVACLPETVGRFREEHHGQVNIVDDKSDNIARLQDRIDRWKAEGTYPEGLDINLIWINQGRTKDRVPEGMTVEEFKAQFTTIDDIRQLRDVHQSPGVTTWFIDYDHTLVHTNGWREQVFASLESHLGKTEPIICPILDERVGLNGHDHVKEEFKNGMSGADRIVRVGNGVPELDKVAKYNPNNRERVIREMRGFKLLQQTALAPHLIAPERKLPQYGLLVYPFYPGIQLREGIKNGAIDEQLALDVLRSVVELEGLHWSRAQSSDSDSELRSMQREEWNDTVAGIQTVIGQFESRFGLTSDQAQHGEIVINGVVYPSLGHCVRAVEDIFKQRPPYTVVAHNDLTGANLLVNPDERSFKVVDYEWAGQADPAESLVRTVKYISTTTLRDTPLFDVQASDGRVVINTSSVMFNPLAEKMQALGLSLTGEVGRLLGDGEFERRFALYLAGSYLREVALSLRRGTPETALLATVMAARQVATAQQL